jgi:hypothetical protein
MKQRLDKYNISSIFVVLQLSVRQIQSLAHIFATSKANWEEIKGILPKYESYELGKGYKLSCNKLNCSSSDFI